MHAYLAVTCHLHFWQHDRGLLRATAVTRGWNGGQNKSAQKVDLGEENSPAAPAGIRTRGGVKIARQGGPMEGGERERG